MATQLLNFYDSNGISTRWLVKTCRLLVDGDWPTNQPITFDGSGFSTETRDEANRIFLTAASRHGKGESLNLKNIKLNSNTRKLLEEAISSNSNLQNLSFYNVSFENDDEPSSNSSFFLPSSLSSKPKTIRNLVIEKCKIGPHGALSLKKLMKSSQSLTSLKLINVDLVSDCDEIFNGIENSSLMNLEFQNARISEKNLATLFHSISPNKTLESLSLDNCGIGSKSVGDLAELLATNQHLKTLSICSNDLDGRGIEILVDRGLKSNTSLRKLSLSQNPIGDLGAKVLATLLCSNSSIRSLTVVDCEIWGPGCRSLALGLANMDGLEELAVDGEWEDHVDVLLKSLESNVSLKHLWTDCTAQLFHTDAEWKKVNFYLRLNRGKRRLLVHPDVPASFWPVALYSVSNDASLIYHMLRYKPEIAA